MKKGEFGEGRIVKAKEKIVSDDFQEKGKQKQINLKTPNNAEDYLKCLELRYRRIVEETNENNSVLTKATKMYPNNKDIDEFERKFTSLFKQESEAKKREEPATKEDSKQKQQTTATTSLQISNNGEKNLL
ncbi:uncharacterized protein [Rutidosis leptorrhynchoides]|uniref:uncharacterized protein n=1 Tax=Rutidosis leptorrhynchoides TaxID=125765 RepID=UPI003A9A2C8A